MKKIPDKKAEADAQSRAKIEYVTTEKLCDLFDLTKARIGQLGKDGIIFKAGRNSFDLWPSVKGYISFLQKNKVDGARNIERSDAVGDAQELEELVRLVKSARTYNDARTLKVQIDALRSGYALEVEQNRYCSVAQIEDGMDGIASVVRNAIKRLEADLPPMLEGLDASSMRGVISEKVAAVIQIIYDEGERLKAPAQVED